MIEQRFNYNNNRLAQERIDKLNEIGFVWKLRWVATAKDRDISPWEDKFDRLRAYKEKHGTCLGKFSFTHGLLMLILYGVQLNHNFFALFCLVCFT